MTFSLSVEGEPTYQLSFSQKEVIKNSKLGFVLQDAPELLKGFTIQETSQSSENTTWQPVWGEVKEIRNQYNELLVKLYHSETKRLMLVRFRLFDDGLGFRYEFPEQAHLKYFVIKDEKTEFQLTSDHKTFWISGDYDTNEYPYTTSKLSEVNAFQIKNPNEILSRATIAKNAVQTPLMMKSDDGLYINIFEAALVNYSAMHLLIDQNTFLLRSQLTPDALGNKAYMQTPCQTPWRTILVSDKAADIIASKMILNLNEPCKIEDVSWIKPQKMIGVWWEMHIGKSTWNYSDIDNVKLTSTNWKALKPNGKHGANTERTMQYIDFAAKHGFQGVLVEGWNVGWEDWIGNWKEEVFDFVTPYPDFDVKKLQEYAQSKGVKLIMHHETSGAVTNYERRLDEALKFMKENGYETVKTGYVGRIIPRGEFHDGQWMVNHYVRVAEKMAKYKIMLDAHEPVRPTGLHRTYPNWLACEAARGNEFNAWSSGNSPEHETILPFTRLLGGPMDYTPGIFQIKLDYFQEGKKESIHTTLAKQLALYVTMYSPLQMAADLPETYERFMDAFQFIKDVPVDWDDTKVIEAEPGDYLTISRKAKGKDEWYLGAITDENPRKSNISLDFLSPDKTYLATIYADAIDAHWDKNPMAYQITNVLVNQKTVLALNLAAGGGTAISFKQANTEDLKKYKAYKNSKGK
ncbi:MAG: glycoside hydrolase family 97 protein [Flammeovirgaceae bacterium]